MRLMREGKAFVAILTSFVLTLRCLLPSMLKGLHPLLARLFLYLLVAVMSLKLFTRFVAFDCVYSGPSQERAFVLERQFENFKWCFILVYPIRSFQGCLLRRFFHGMCCLHSKFFLTFSQELVCN